MNKKSFTVLVALLIIFSPRNVYGRNYGGDIYTYNESGLHIFNQIDGINSYYERANVTKKGIDVSKWQGKIDWERVKESGVEFAIIRDGFGVKLPGHKDRFFDINIIEAHKNGIDCGVYHYSYAKNEYEAEGEAYFCLENLKGQKFEYPIVFDIEEDEIRGYGRDKLANICQSFCRKIREKGYYACIYANLNWVTNYLDNRRLFGEFDLWLARYNRSASSIYPCGIWQYTSSGCINGINGNVDCNISYFDYPKIMRDLNYNGF